MRVRVFATFCMLLVVFGQVHSFEFPSFFRRTPKIETKKIDSSAEDPIMSLNKANEKTKEELSKLEDLAKKLGDKAVDDESKERHLSDVSSSELVKRVKKAQSEKKSMKVMVFAYSIARLLDSASPIIAVPYPNVYWALRGLKLFVEQFVTPMDTKFKSHRRDYVHIMNHVRKVHPDHKEDDEVELQNKKGEVVKVKIENTKALRKQDRIPLNKLEPAELLSKAWKMK